MLHCPACFKPTIPNWRKYFSGRERFKCPNCAVWLAYRTQDSSPSRKSSGRRWSWIRLSALALCFHALTLIVIGGLLYAKCYIAMVPSSVGWMFLLALAWGGIGSELSRLKRRRLSVAERQDSRPSLDGLRDMASIAMSREGRSAMLSLLLFLALIFGGAMTWRPIALELRKALPPPSSCETSGLSKPTLGPLAA